MSQPRRRRRRGRRGGGGSSGSTDKPREQAQPQQRSSQSGAESSGQGSPRRGRRRRRGRSGGGPQGSGSGIPSPKSSEDLFGLLVAGEKPEVKIGEPDGTVLEEVIGDLQSSWGVPQYPQEYRITLRVADSKERQPSNVTPSGGEPVKKDDPRGPKREKAPSVGRLAGNGGDGTAREKAPRRRRRRRGRRRGPGEGGGGNGQGPSNGSTPPPND